MRDQQVEVVPGPHVAARVAGAVLLVAHRGQGRPTEDAPALRALVALAELVHEAATHRPDEPGALIARAATRWLMAQADRTGRGAPVDFGILSAAGPDRVAIFLHGGVTALVDGPRTEYFHGRDAVFTVDRAAVLPARAVALFVDEDTGSADALPALPPARGIGRLVEGVAEAAGVIAWSPPARAGRTPVAPVSGGISLDRKTPRVPASGPAVSDTSGFTISDGSAATAGIARIPASGEPPGTTGPPRLRTPAAVTAEPGPAPPGVADDVPTAAAAPMLDSVELSQRGDTVAGSESTGGSRTPATDAHHAETEISGRQPASGPPGGPPVPGEFDETSESRPRHGDPAGRPLPAHPTPRVDLPVSPGPPLHGPPERRVPPLDAELRRRTEATAKGAALTVKVMGFKCARAHPTDPRAAFCSVCGMPVDQTQPLIEVVRPPLGILVLDDGATYLLDADSVLGRDPEGSEQARRGLTPLPVVDNSGGMSRAHAELLLVNWDVTLVDRGSTNGTRTRATGYREWVRVPPYQPVVLVPGTEILIGQRMLRYESAAPPPFGS